MSDEFQRGYREGQQAVYAAIRKLFGDPEHSPWFKTDFDGSWKCDWCDATEETEDDDATPPHPPNDCLWAKAHQAGADPA